MKKLIIPILMSLSLFSCKKEEEIKPDKSWWVGKYEFVYIDSVLPPTTDYLVECTEDSLFFSNLDPNDNYTERYKLDDKSEERVITEHLPTTVIFTLFREPLRLNGSFPGVDETFLLRRID